MTLLKKLKSRRGFTLAELMIVVAMIAVLAGIAFAFINPKDISHIEYNRSAEAIAAAAQNRLTEIRNAGDMEQLRNMGESAAKPGNRGEATATAATETAGGYRFVFSYVEKDGVLARNPDISYILPFGAIEYGLAQNYYAIGFQSDTGMVGEVFYSEQPFGAYSADYLIQLAGNPELRKAENVGYYKGEVDDAEIAFANLPTPQLTITNHEELTLSIYLPEVRQLEAYGKQLGVLVSLSDEDGEAFKNGLDLTQTAIYSTFSLGDAAAAHDPTQPVVTQKIASGATYTIVLDTVKTCEEFDMKSRLAVSDDIPAVASAHPPKGIFENWAKRSAAYDKNYFLLGDNSVITVTVYCLYSVGDENYSENFPIDPTFMPRSASVTFNGWFNHYKSGTVDIACGRHLQNLGKLTEMRKNLVPYLPEYTEKDGVYTYGDFDYGMASAYTYSNSHGNPPTSQDDIAQKFTYRSHVKTSIKKAQQVQAIDFDCSEWKEDGKQIAFTPVNLPKDFYYYGNYLTINHLYVNAPFYAGLFGYTYHPRLYDILLVNPSVTSQMPAHLAEVYEMGVGALIGTSRDSSHINNCQAYMSQENGTYDPDKYRVTGECYVGGLIGFCEDEDIANCSASVYTGYKKGAEKTVVIKTESGAETTASVPISSKYVGGLIGCITGDGSLEDCYAAGNLSGEYVGGLIGYITEDSDPSGDDYRIETCYTAGHIEYAAVSAAGILGHIAGYGGNAKAALSVYGNYCVVIYGEKSGNAYKWNSSAPIYGTFEGDGFEWLRTHDFYYGDNYLKGKYAGFTFFAGASFENTNKNYYIAQRGIRYSSSPYFTAMSKTVQDLMQEIKNTSDKTLLLEKVEAAIDKMVWLKKLQTLDKLKEIVENILYEVESETGVDADGRPYNKGGYYQCGPDIYLDTTRAKVEGENNESGHTYTSALTVAQALHAMYDGTYTDDAGNKQTVTMLYKGSDGNKKKLHETYNFTNYTFMDYYNFLQTEYNTLLSDSATEAQKTAAKEALKVIFGDNTSETYDTVDTNGNPTKANFYQAGMFYQCFYSDLLYRLFDKAKDYYETDKNDKTGELIYRHFRDLVSDNFCELLCDLGMSPVERDKMLENVKQTNVQAAIDAMADYPNITAKWSGPMKPYADEAKGYASAAKTALESLLTELKTGSYTTEEIQPYIDDAIKKLDPLYSLLDAHKAGDDGNKESDWDAVDSSGTKGDMRNLRDPIANFRAEVSLCTATANSGVENALKVLQKKLGKTDANVTAAVDDFIKNVNTYLGTDRGTADSGYRLYNATQLRNAARGYVNGDDKGTRESSLGFMYDYGNSYKKSEKELNPYYGHVNNDSYVDLDNQIYNNVFPYNENENTSYYPFPFVYGREVEAGERSVYVLFHYGDWLTEDMWMAPTVTYHTDYPASAEYPGTKDFSGEDITLSQQRVTNAESFAPDDVTIRSNDENVDVPFYFDGWYVDEDCTTPYSEEVHKEIEAAAANGESINFDLYAKWIAKPSLVFYGADLQGTYNRTTINVDTTMTLTSGDQQKVSAQNNSYEQITAWLKPEQEVTLSVSGHYIYNFMGKYEDSGPVLENRTNGAYTYIVDSLTIVFPTEFTGAVWFDQNNIDRDLGTVTFSVPAAATFADKYELTLSESSGEGGSGFDFNICLAEGTMIRMADGSTKAIEDLEVGDMVLAFNHLTVEYEPTRVWMTPHTELGSKLYRVTTLTFSDGSALKIAGEHGLFDRTLGKYVFINERNYEDYLGHEFSAISVTASGVEDKKVTLVSVSEKSEITRIYSPVTENQLNIVAEDLLTVTSMMGYGDAVMNLFDYDPDMGYNKAAMAADIDKYGVYGYDDFADLLPQEVFSKVPLKVMKVAVGKGLISYEEVRQIIEYIYRNGYLSY